MVCPVVRNAEPVNGERLTVVIMVRIYSACSTAHFARLAGEYPGLQCATNGCMSTVSHRVLLPPFLRGFTVAGSAAMDGGIG